MSNKYQYTKLATYSTIRVIKLEQKKVDNTITCIIRHVEQPRFHYHALSYVWGDPTPTRHIFVSDSTSDSTSDVSKFPLHETLWRFLNWAWERKMFEHWIWTDRICLNQEDSDEIAGQIPRMGQIFHGAYKVLAWLDMSRSEGESLANLLSPSESTEVKSKSRKETPPQTLHAMKKAYGNKYWERVWIVQEIVNASWVTILIGDLEVPLETMSAEFRLYGSERGDDPLRLFPIESVFLLASQRARNDLAEVLHTMNSGQFYCERPQDRVYGGLGLVADRAGVLSPVYSIGVDYSKSYPEILLDAILETELSSIYSFHRMLALLLRESQIGMQEPIFDLFKRYLESNKTSWRHKELADRVVQACDAFNIMFVLSGCHPGCQSYSDILRRCLAHSINIDLSERDNAALLGISLGLGIVREAATSIFEHWKASREPLISVKSPWRCTTHQAQNGPGSPASKNASHAQDEFSERDEYMKAEMRGNCEVWCWRPRRLVNACGEYCPDSPQSCDASTMTFEMPEGGFRVILRYLPRGRQYLDRKFDTFKAPPIGCDYVDPDDEEYVRNEGCYGEMVLQFLDQHIRRRLATPSWQLSVGDGISSMLSVKSVTLTATFHDVDASGRVISSQRFPG